MKKRILCGVLLCMFGAFAVVNGQLTDQVDCVINAVVTEELTLDQTTLTWDIDKSMTDWTSADNNLTIGAYNDMESGTLKCYVKALSGAWDSWAASGFKAVKVSGDSFFQDPTGFLDPGVNCLMGSGACPVVPEVSGVFDFQIHADTFWAHQTPSDVLNETLEFTLVVE